MKIIPTFCCRLISKRISKIFRKSQNKKPTIVKEKIGFKLNLGIISFRLCRKESLVEFATQLNLGIFQFEWSREWSSLNGKNATHCGGAGSIPALHSFYPTFIKSNNVGALISISASYRYERLSFQ